MKFITKKLIDDLVLKSGESHRRRMNINFHENHSELVQRMIVATKIDTYFRPHKHINKSEFALVIRGYYDLLLFDDCGNVMQRATVGMRCENIGFEIEPGVWHTWLPREEDSVFFEVKQGPYVPETAIEFAAWSPSEGTGETVDFLKKLKSVKVGENMAQYISV
ncbi:MAG: WbuC family cupin fold metalloprotein [Desulfobacterales bacterium]|nr:WbuC family cupin fold metalloprotein [Desulfobacterales bacterium]MBF0398103.1 WbuC family cupin fold metalloprotein [Desulfobacterales bacterium]